MALILHVLQCVHSRYDYYKSHHVVNVVCRVNYGNVTLHVKKPHLLTHYGKL